MNKLPLLTLFLFFAMLASAQKNSFGIVSYTIPEEYQLVKNDNLLTYIKQDGKSGAYCKFVIYKMLPDRGGPQKNFEFFWTNMVQKAFNVPGAANVQPQASIKGWDLLLGTTMYEDNGVSTLLLLGNFSGENTMQNIVIQSNADLFKPDIEHFIASVDVVKDITQSESVKNSNTTPPIAATNPSIVGTWTFMDIQGAGTMIGFSNEMGYTFNPDGTYYFFKKLNVKGTKKISFAYETGKWSVNGNRLTITPGKGQNEEWSASQTTKSYYSSKLPGWGSKLKTTPRKLETITYTFEKKTLPAADFKSLLLQYDKPTERDGQYNYDSSNHLSRFSPMVPYPDALPPGFTPDFLNTQHH